MVETPAHLAGATQADVDPDLEPAATSNHRPRCRRAVRHRPPVSGWCWVAGAGCHLCWWVAGALARYGLTEAFPHAGQGFAWVTFGINVSGCLLIGMLMVLVSDVWPTRRLLRPLVGTGVLGGYTTFSTYIVDIQQLLAAGAARTALTYLAAIHQLLTTGAWLPPALKPS